MTSWSLWCVATARKVEDVCYFFVFWWIRVQFNIEDNFRQQLFGPLYIITISLKPIRLNKTEMKIIAEKKLVYISPPSACTTLWPLSHLATATVEEPTLKFCWLSQTDIADETRDSPVHSSPQRKFQKCAARVLIRPDQTAILCRTFNLTLWKFWSAARHHAWTVQDLPDESLLLLLWPLWWHNKGLRTICNPNSNLRALRKI